MEYDTIGAESDGVGGTIVDDEEVSPLFMLVLAGFSRRVGR